MLATLAPPPMLAMTPTIDDLAFLSGAWTLERGGRRTPELWMAPAGNTMVGMSRAVAGERVVQHEFLSTLLAAIGGPRGGTNRRTEFPYLRRAR